MTVALALAGLLLAGCADRPAPAPPSQRFASFASAPAIVARDDAEVATAQARAQRIGALGAGAGATRIEEAAAPFLHGSPAGRRFLAARPPRALALGDPPERCPALGLAEGRTSAASDALSACLAQLRQRGADGACGCRIVALDDALTAPPERFRYAPGVSARLIGPAAGAGRLLIAEERAAPDGRSVRVAFSGPDGPVAAADLAEDGAARLVDLETGALWTGRREPVGWRRGRLAERLLLEGPGGARLIALIGFEPDEMADAGAALARWRAADG
jgi:hypothetical protein